jgi:hypothetical protein
LATRATLLVWLALRPVAATPDLVRRGDEHAVNTYTTGRQQAPAAAMAPDGGVLVVWTGAPQQDGIDEGVFARRLHPSGVWGPEFQVNEYTFDAQQRPSVAVSPSGAFVVVWESDNQDGSLTAVMGRRFDDAGAPLAGDFQVNTYTTGRQAAAAVAMLSDGGFVVVWASNGQDGSDSGIFQRRYDAAGVPQGVEAAVNTYTTGPQQLPHIAAASGGGFVVVWSGDGTDGGTPASGVFGRRYDAAGIALGAEFRVSTSNGGSEPAVAADASARFVVAWQYQDGGGVGIAAQRFDAAGAREGAEVPVNTFTTGFQAVPSVAGDGRGGFVVTWHGDQQDGSGLGIFARRYDESGAPHAPEFQVNTYTSGWQLTPVVAGGTQGDFLVAWASDGQDGDSTGIFAQRFAPDRIFQDGFDAGS